MRAKRRGLARAEVREKGLAQGIGLELRQDSDGAYRWYEESSGADTEVSADTLEGAVEAAGLAWAGFWCFSFLTRAGIDGGCHV